MQRGFYHGLIACKSLTKGTFIAPARPNQQFDIVHSGHEVPPSVRKFHEY